MSTRYTLTTATLPVYPGGFQSALLVYNQGPGTVYLSDQPNVTSVTGWPVAKGSVLTWTAGKPLYASTDTTATIVADTNAGSMTSAADVATALIDSGLAQDIATAISITGVPPKDDAHTIYSYTGTVPYGTTFNMGGPPYINIGAYQSVEITVTAKYNGPTGLNDTYTVFTFMKADYNDGNSPATSFDSVECCLSQFAANSSAMVLPAIGTGLWIGLQIDQSSGSTNQSTDITITVTGSYRSVPYAKKFGQSDAITPDSPMVNGLDDVQYGFNVSLAASTSQSISLPFINAPMDLSFTCLTSTAPVSGTDIYVSSATPNRQVAGSYADKTPAFNIVRYQSIKMGGRMPRLWLNNKDSFAKSYNFAVSFMR